MSNTPLKFLSNISGALSGAVTNVMSNVQSPSDNSFTRARAMRRQRIQDALGFSRGKRGRGALDTLFNRGARGETRRQRMLAAGAAPSIAEQEGTSEVSGTASAQQPVQPEALAPADTQGAFDANLGLVRTADPSMMFGANKAKLNAMNDLGRDPYNAFDDYRTAAQRSTAEQAKINNDLRYGRSGRLTGSSLDQAIMRSGTDLGYTPRQGMQERQYDYSKLGYEMSSNANLANLFAGRTALYFKKQKTK
jgi:hypothetical protein